MLEQAPAHRLADLFVAAFEDGFDARLEAGGNTCISQVHFLSALQPPLCYHNYHLSLKLSPS